MPTPAPRPLNLAEILEAIADAVPERAAIITMDRTYTYAGLDERTSRLAQHLRSLGLTPGDHVAVHASNRIEWVDAFYGCFKARVVPININYKYRHDELAHVYEDADCVAAIVAPEHVGAVRALALPRLRHVLVMGPEYDAALAAASTERLVGRRSDDHYVLYTGGTTGRPKGVVWRQEDIILAALNAARRGAPIDSVEQLAAEAQAKESAPIVTTCGPMMHGGSQWVVGNTHVSGATVALYTEPRFDPEKVLDFVEKAGANSLVVLGDAMGRPIAEAILAKPERWDLTRLVSISNGAAPLSESVRAQIRQALPGRILIDGYGSSESGTTGSLIDDDEGSASSPRFGVGDEVEVFDAEMNPCPAGVEGLLGRTGRIPLGYYKDPVKTASTFRVVHGVRWSVPGDAARREEDGSVTILGRGSVCINTGGEKVHPEEVEAVLLRHVAVADAAVVGLPHERWGQQITALVQRRDGTQVSDSDLIQHVRKHLSAYKAPKQIFFVAQVPRTHVGKVDYRASTELALSLNGGPA